MNNNKLIASLFFGTVILVLAIIFFYSNLINFNKAKPIQLEKNNNKIETAIIFSPPPLEDAPSNIKSKVLRGYNILANTKEYLPDHVGNNLTCSNCHFNSGRDRKSISFVGVTSKYNNEQIINLVNECFEKSLNGTALPAGGSDMQSLLEYFKYISKDIPKEAAPPWLGLDSLKGNQIPDATKGEKVYIQKCLQCHGDGGVGTLIAPAVWGKDSFSDSSKLNKVYTLARFAYRFMPKGNPTLSVPEALNVAAFLISRPRPNFNNSKNEIKTNLR